MESVSQLGRLMPISHECKKNTTHLKGIVIGEVRYYGEGVVLAKMHTLE